MLNPEKCYFARPKLGLLGHIVSQDGLQVDPAKVQKLVDMRPPKTITEIKSFLGLASYYWRFVQDFAKIAAPLIKKTQKDASLEWNQEAQDSFDALKESLTTAPVLNYPNPANPFILTTDASAIGLGAMLSQIGEDGKEHAIAYASKSLQPSQASYAATHLEALAVIWAVNKFRHYVYGREFTLRTDHSALVSVLHTTKPLTGMLARWAAFLQEYQFKAEHRAGKENPTDVLSRIVSAVEETVGDIVAVRAYLEKDQLPEDAQGRRRIKRKASSHFLQDGSLFRKDGKKTRKVLETREERLLALSQLHNEKGHPGINNTLAALNKRF